MTDALFQRGISMKEMVNEYECVRGATEVAPLILACYFPIGRPKELSRSALNIMRQSWYNNYFTIAKLMNCDMITPKAIIANYK
jgi:hypothetical protein